MQATSKKVWKDHFNLHNEVKFHYKGMVIEIIGKNDCVSLIADGFECCKVDDIDEALATVNEW